MKKKYNFNSFYIGYVKFRKFSDFEENQSKKKKKIILDSNWRIYGYNTLILLYSR